MSKNNFIEIDGIEKFAQLTSVSSLGLIEYFTRNDVEGEYSLVCFSLSGSENKLGIRQSVMYLFALIADNYDSKNASIEEIQILDEFDYLNLNRYISKLWLREFITQSEELIEDLEKDGWIPSKRILEKLKKK